MADSIAQSYANHRRTSRFHFVHDSVLAVYLFWRLYRVISSRFIIGGHLSSCSRPSSWGCSSSTSGVPPGGPEPGHPGWEERLRWSGSCPSSKGASRSSPSRPADRHCASRATPEVHRPARRVLDEHIHDQNVIKKQIQSWRPDHLRA